MNCVNYKNKDNSPFLSTLIKSIGISYLITIVFFIIFAIIMTYTSLQENIIPVANSIIMIISIAIGAIYMALRVESKGWLNGALIGLIYIVILITIRQLIFTPLQLDGYLMIRIAISLITGSVGGMIGVNLK